MLIDWIGWIGALLLATSCLPQAIKTLKVQRFEGLSIAFIYWWLFGAIFMLFYVLYGSFSWPLIFNYSLNILVCVIILEVYFITKFRNI